ncbi:MAG: hypothetical protein J6I68_14115 [Butyrivibrio sp.]|uniref:hypothetical protein n=1 Tax=Butyrivibrio sp. TaxID=28121 RepID=UPI001B5994E4|nr:hypothetical protein [Butyrivibrio sp.]MBP3784376.1 hypothetical protein [Butyrivibrio sp.]MBP3813129.1 hypothetical protein [Butyrivibrio sp.]
MSVFTVTKNEAEAFKDFFPEDIYSNIGKENYYTLGAFDDEEFVAGVLQFFVGFDENKGTYSKVCYLYVQEDFVDSFIAASLLAEYESIAAESGISYDLMETIDDSSVYVFASSAKKFWAKKTLDHVSPKDIYSISFIENLEFIKIKKQVAKGTVLEQKRFYEDEISSFYKAKDGCALLLVKKGKLEDLVMTYIDYDNPDIDEKLTGLISYSAKRAMDLYGEDQYIRIECGDYDSLTRFGKALPDILPQSFIDQD